MEVNEVNSIRKYFAELVGTMVLVFMGCGAAVFLGCGTDGGHLAVALAFGLSIVAMAYIIGPISGCHINPAVSLGALITKRIGPLDFICYVVFQIIGAIIGAGLLWGVLNVTDPAFLDMTGGALGSNTAGVIGVTGSLLIEIILTFIFVLVILGVTTDKTKGGVAGIVIGLTLTFVHIVGIPLTGTSVNPARSIGPALFSDVSSSLPDLWIFIVAPLIGAALAAAVFIGLYGWKKASLQEDI
jgi:aquaporin Z